MIVTETHHDGLEKTFAVTVPVADLSARLEARIEEVRSSIRLKGFRPGKVPASHIRKIHGRSLMNEVVRVVIDESTRKLFDEKKLRPALRPDVRLVSETDAVTALASDLEFTLHVETLPEIEPVELSGLHMVRYVADIPEEEADKAAHSLAVAGTTYHTADGARAQEGDACLIDYDGRINGTIFSGGSAQDQLIILGQGRYLPGFEQALHGTAAGEEQTITVPFPDDYHGKDVAGKEAVFTLKIKEIRHARIPAVDDALATSLGLKNLAALRDILKARLQADYGERSRQMLKRDILDWLDMKRDIALPPGLVGLEKEKIRSEREAADQSEEAKTGEAAGEDDALQATAERRVRLGLLLADIGRAAGIEVKEAELERAVKAEISRHRGREKEAAAFFRDHPEMVDHLRAPLYEGKVIDYIIERADITSKTLSLPEFAAEAESGGAGGAGGKGSAGGKGGAG